jgi:hypothetical protein
VTIPVLIKIQGGSTGFAEDKDEARRIRVSSLLPALERNLPVVLDFSEVTYSTQSFVHALLGEALKRFNEEVLKDIEFRGCTPQLQSLVQLVVDYSLGGFQTSGSVAGNQTPQAEGPQNKPAKRTPTRKTAR